MSVANALAGRELAVFSITLPWNMSARYVPVKDSAMVAAPRREQLHKAEAR
jgi:hypothetical protein